jgi:hypothetical protein
MLGDIRSTRCERHRWQVEKSSIRKVLTSLSSRVNIKIIFFLQFALGADNRSCWLLIPGVQRDLRISPRIFEKIRNDPNVIFRGLEEDDS